MQPKKNRFKDLKNYVLLYGLLGLSVSLSFALMAFEYREYQSSEILGYVMGQAQDDIEEIPAIPEEKIEPPQPPEPEVREIEIPDEPEEEDQPWEDIEATEFDEDEILEFEFEAETEPEEEAPEVFIVVEKMPAFKGCEHLSNQEAKVCTQQKMLRHAMKNFVYPQICKEAGITGKLMVYFEVAPSGKVENTKMLIEGHKLLNQEAMRVVNSFPDFQPGMQQGKKVRVSYRIPFNINLK